MKLVSQSLFILLQWYCLLPVLNSSITFQTFFLKAQGMLTIFWVQKAFLPATSTVHMKLMLWCKVHLLCLVLVVSKVWFWRANIQLMFLAAILKFSHQVF